MWRDASRRPVASSTGRVLTDAIMGVRSPCALWTLMTRRRPDMSERMNSTGFFPSRRAVAASALSPAWSAPCSFSLCRRAPVRPRESRRRL